MEKEYISATQAHIYLLKNGFEMSYPTALAFLRRVPELTCQPTGGKRSTILVDKDMLEKHVKSMVRKAAKKPRQEEA